MVTNKYFFIQIQDHGNIPDRPKIKVNHITNDAG